MSTCFSWHASAQQADRSNSFGPIRSFDQGAVFDEVASLVAKRFYQVDFDKNEWQDRASAFRTRAVTATDLDEFANVMNELLSTLETSHTYYFSKNDPRRFQLLGIFSALYPEADPAERFQYAGIGIVTRNVDGHWRVTGLLNGFSAEKSEIRYGDTIHEVNDRPFHPIGSFERHVGEAVVIKCSRSDGTKYETTVEVQLLDGRTMFETALKESFEVIERNGKKIAYAHAWSYAGTQYQEALRQALLWGELSECDSLILDLRDGWGGADVNYLNLFREPIVRIQSKSRSEPERNFTGVWGKPVVLLTNSGSTSGKELFSFGFKKLKLGKIVGEETAGAVVAGSPNVLSNGDVLYLAVSDIKVDGVRLEGVGVKPDVEVKRPLNGIKGPEKLDPQREAAIQLLVEGQ